MGTALRVCLTLTMVAAVCSTSTARIVDKDFHETFDVSEGVTLRLEHGDGDVTIEPWEQDVIDVDIRYRADIKVVGFGAEADFNVEARQTDDRVTIRGIEGSARGVYFVHYVNEYEYTYTIKAPSYVILDLAGDDGDVGVSGWRADIECALDDGDVEFSDVVNSNTEIRVEDGDVRLSALSCDLVVKGDDGNITVTDSSTPLSLFSLEDGDVRVSDSTGRFDATVDDGDVTLSRVEASVVDVRGEDGSVDLDITSGEGVNINVATDDGDVVIRLARGLPFSYLVTTDDGRVNVNLEGEIETESSEHRWSGRVGRGGGMVRVSTSDGGVKLTTAK